MIRMAWLAGLALLTLVVSGRLEADVVPSAVLRLADTQEIHTDLSEGAYQALVGGVSGRGFSLVSASAVSGPRGLRFSAIIERVPPDRAWAARHGLSARQALDFMNDHVGRRGWSLRSLAVYATPSGFRYLVVVDDQRRPGIYVPPALDVDGRAWNAVFAQQLAEGRYPAIASVAMDAQGQAVIAAYFQPADGLEFLSWQGRDQSQFLRDHLDATRRGFAPVFLGSFTDSRGQPAFSGVWTSTGPPADILVNASETRLPEIVSVLHAQGRRILRISAASASAGCPVYSLQIVRPANQPSLDPDGANFPLPVNTAGNGPGQGAGGGNSGGSFGGGFTPGGRVVPGSGGGGGTGGGGNNPGDSGAGGRDPNDPSDPTGNRNGLPVQPGDPVWCNYYTFGGSHVGLTINSPSDSPLVSRNWGTVLCEDPLHRAEVERGRRAEDHQLGIYVPWAQATNVSEAANCLRTDRVQWISEEPDPENRRVWERVGGSIWDGISVRECEACGQMIAYAGMNYCRRYGYPPQ